MYSYDERMRSHSVPVVGQHIHLSPQLDYASLANPVVQLAPNMIRRAPAGKNVPRSENPLRRNPLQQLLKLHCNKRTYMSCYCNGFRSDAKSISRRRVA